MSDGAIFYTMGLDTKAFGSGMQQAIRHTRQMDSTMGRLPRSASAAGNGLRGADKAARGLGGGLSSALVKAGPLLAALGGLTAAGAGLKKAFNLAADFEQTEVAFRTLIGNAEQTERTLDGIKNLGSSTPFEFPALADAGRKLIAFGEGADTVVSTLRRIGDVSAGIQAPVGEIAEIYGKARVQGTLFAEDINQLSGRGIPIIAELAKVMGTNEQAVKGLASQGKITFPYLEQAFRNMTASGGKFHGMMAAQSKTTNGLLSTLKDNVNDVFRALGQPLNDAIRPMLEDAVGIASRVGTGVVAAVKLAKAAVSQGKIGEILSLGLKIGLKEGANYGVGTFLFMGQALLKSIEFGLRSSWTFMTGGFNQAFGNIFGGLWKMLLGLGKIILSTLGDPFLEITAMFQAGLSVAIDKSIGSLLKIPGMQTLLGLDDWEQTPFGEYLEDFKKDMNVGALKTDGEKLFGDGLSQIGKGITQGVDVAAQDFVESLNGLQFGKSGVFDTSADKDTLAKIAQNLAPDEFKKLMDALTGKTTANTKAQAEAAEKAKNLGKAFDAAGKGVKKQDADEKEKSGRKRIRLFNARDSVLRRFGRLSSADKKRYGGDLKGFLAADNTTSLQLRGALGEGGYKRFLAKFGGITGKARKAVGKGVGGGAAKKAAGQALATEKTLGRVAASLENLGTI